MAPPRRRGAASSAWRLRPRRGLVLRPAARGRALRRRASWPRAGRRARGSRRDRAARRAGLRPGAARVPAAGRDRGARRPAPGRRRTARVLDGAGVLVAEPLGEGPEPRLAVSTAPRHDLDAVAVVIHTSGTTAAPRPVELTYGNLLWSALGSGVALGLDQNERWLCALTLAHVGGLSILVRAAIRGHDGDRPRALRGRQGAARPARAASDAHQPRRDHARAPARRRACERPEHLRCALTGGGPVPAALRRRAPRKRAYPWG